jgi:hypothetical protein
MVAMLKDYVGKKIRILGAISSKDEKSYELETTDKSTPDLCSSAFDLSSARPHTSNPTLHCADWLVF